MDIQSARESPTQPHRAAPHRSVRSPTMLAIRIHTSPRHPFTAAPAQRAGRRRRDPEPRSMQESDDRANQVARRLESSCGFRHGTVADQSPRSVSKPSLKMTGPQPPERHSRTNGYVDENAPSVLPKVA